MPPETGKNLDWVKRGWDCRERRVNGGRYRTHWQQAELFGMTGVQIARMESGEIDPTQLEQKWAECPVWS